MGFWSSVLGRSRPSAPRLDALFAIPSAAITLQSSFGLVPTGVGSVCYRAASGAGFDQTQDEAVELLGASPDAPDVAVTRDEFGFTWLTVTHVDDAEAADGADAASALVDLSTSPAPDTSALCTDLHAVNSTLEEAGFGPGLLCSLVAFADRGGRRTGLVYLYKQGTFYPFAPTGPGQRDNLLEISVRDALAGELAIEQDRSRWLAVWGAPGL